MISLRHLLYGGVFLVSCVACREENLVGSVPEMSDHILFDTPSLSVETVSRSTLKNALAPGETFGVLGYCVPYTVGTTEPNYHSASSVWSLKRNQCPPDVFFKQKVIVGVNGCTYDREGGTDNDPRFWYRDGYDTNNNPVGAITGADQYHYSFIAYYPYEEAFTVDQPLTETTAGAPKLTFTMPQSGSALTHPLSHSETPDAMLAVLYNSRKSDGNLRFNFSHILTGIGFEVNNFSEFDLTVHSLTLSGSFYKTIKIDLTKDVASYTFPEDDRYVGTYTIFDEDLPLPPPDVEKNETVTSSGLLGGEHLLLISGTNTSFGEDVKVRIDYTFNGRTTFYETQRPGTFSPRPGIKYTAQLNFVGDAFVLEFVVDNQGQWEDGEADDGDETNDDVVFE